MAKNKNWSAKVTRESFALDLEEGVFTWKNPKRIAKSLMQSALNSTRRKASPFQSAISMLNFYINRAGKNLKPDQKKVLEKAKEEIKKIGTWPFDPSVNSGQVNSGAAVAIGNCSLDPSVKFRVNPERVRGLTFG